MHRRRLLHTVGAAGAVGIGAVVAAQDGNDDDDGSGPNGGGDGDGTNDDFDTIRVPEAEPTVQAGVDAAAEGDLVLVGEGTYEEGVEVATPGITLRGRDRNAVVLDGGFELTNAVDVEADGVAVENLTLRHYTGNGVYWSGVSGFRGSFLTAYNNGYYGVYAYDSRDGRFEYSYASGHPDAGFYLGRNRPYDAVISDVIAEYNGMGYSGTSAGGNLTIRDSIWRHNMAGIVPNTLDEEDQPQRTSHIVGNVVYDNNNRDAPAVEYTYPTFGMGIVLWGGSDNLVEDNVVGGHENFGIAAHHNVVEPSGNEVRGNVVRDSGTADLALGEPAGEDNRFEDNRFVTSLPEGLQNDASGGSADVDAVFVDQAEWLDADDPPGGDWRDQPEPGPQPTMRDPEAPPQPATRSFSWGG